MPDLSGDLAAFVLIGFVAQLVDGALGMAFGAISSSLLLMLGVPPAFASASVHTAEIFTTGASGLSHLYHRNIDRRLFMRLAPAGVAGGIVGAYVLTQLPVAIVQPLVTLYLLATGLLILARFWRRASLRLHPAGATKLGLAGGFLDAIGGGGWGPLVTSTLLARGHAARTSIGSVNAAEFFVTVAISVVFLVQLDLDYWTAVLGLVLGGGLAAPLAGLMISRLPERVLLLFVAGIVLSLSVLGVARIAV